MNKEQIYDSEIFPLMEQIMSICKEHKIAMLCTYDIPTEEDADLACTSHTPDESGELPPRIRALARIARPGVATRAMNLTIRKADGSEIIEHVVG